MARTPCQRFYEPRGTGARPGRQMQDDKRVLWAYSLIRAILFRFYLPFLIDVMFD
jgi:hypothetical protein